MWVRSRGEIKVEPLEASMAFRVVAAPSAVLSAGDPDRLVVLCDVRTREVRVVPRRDAQEEADAAWSFRLWRGL